MSIIEQYREKLIGQKFDTNNCGVCEIIDYKNSQQVTVKFFCCLCNIGTSQISFESHLRRFPHIKKERLLQNMNLQV